MLWNFGKIWCENPPKIFCLREIFKPFYLLLSLLGLFPYSIKSRTSSYRFSIVKKSIYFNSTCALFYISILSFFLIMHIRYVYFSMESSAMTAAVVTQINYITELFNLMLFCIVTYFSFYINRFKIMRILNSLASPIDPPNNNSEKILTGLRFHIRVVALGYIGLTCVMQACINFTRTDSTWKMFLVFFTFNLPQLIQFTSLAFFYVLIMIVVGILKDIKEQVSALAREKKIYVSGLVHVDPKRRPLMLSQMEVMYMEICEMKVMVNHVFEAPIMMTLIQCFHCIISESHIIYHGLVAQNNMVVHVIINCSVWIIYQIMKIYAIARTGSVLKQEILKLGKAIQSIPTERQDLRFMMEVGIKPRITATDYKVIIIIFDDHCPDSRFGERCHSEEPRPTSPEALARWLGQGSNIEGSHPGHGTHCQEVPLSVAPTNGSLSPAPLPAAPKVQHFTSTISFYGNGLTAYGIVPLDATLTLKTLAAATMYTIILVQFDKTSETQ